TRVAHPNVGSTIHATGAAWVVPQRLLCGSPARGESTGVEIIAKDLLPLPSAEGSEHGTVATNNVCGICRAGDFALRENRVAKKYRERNDEKAPFHVGLK